MLSRLRKQSLPDHIEIDADGEPLRIRLRTNPRAQRYLLRLPADKSGPVITMPPGGDVRRAERFALQHLDWLLHRLDQRPDHIAFRAGESVPVRGEEHLIIATGKLRGLVSPRLGVSSKPEIHVPGADDHLPRKLSAWLKSEAKADLTAAANRHANSIDRKITAITVRDTRSRWGSCAANGRLSFSWRLILAPPEILDYVAAHEVAHLREMNHSARFWRLCQQLAPQTPDARQWLKENGARLHGYG